jgi:hypothetical protein
MLGDRPALTPPELFYQRMLAGDPAEAVEKAEEFLKERPLSAYYDEVALPGLKLAQNDIIRGSLDRAQSEKMRAAVLEVVDDLADEDDKQVVKGETHVPEAEAAVENAAGQATELPVLARDELAPAWQSPTPVLCAAGRGPLDEAVAAMLGQLLGKHGLNARVASADAIASGAATPLDIEGVALVCLSYLDTSSTAHMRYAIRRLRRKLPHATLVLGCWMADGGQAAIRDITKSDVTVVNLRDAIAYALEIAGSSSPAQAVTLPGLSMNAA